MTVCGCFVYFFFFIYVNILAIETSKDENSSEHSDPYSDSDTNNEESESASEYEYDSQEESSEPDDENDESYTPRSKTRSKKTKIKNTKTKKNKNKSTNKTKNTKKKKRKSKASNKSTKNKSKSTRTSRKQNSKSNNNNNSNKEEPYTGDLHTNGDPIKESRTMIHEMSTEKQMKKYGHFIENTVSSRSEKGVTRTTYLNDPLRVPNSWNPSHMSYARYFSNQHASPPNNKKRKGKDSSNAEFSPQSKKSNSHSKSNTNSNSKSNSKSTSNTTTKNSNDIFRTGISMTDFIPVINIIDPTKNSMHCVGLKNNTLSMRMGMNSKRCRFRTLISRKHSKYLVFVTFDKIKTALGGDLEFHYNVQNPGLTTYPAKFQWKTKDDYSKQSKDVGYNARIFETPAQLELQYLAGNTDNEIRTWFETLKIIGLRHIEYYIARLCFTIAESKKKQGEIPQASGIINLANYWYNFDKIMIAQWCLRQSFLTEEGEKWKVGSDRLLYNLSIKDVMVGQHGGIIAADDEISVYDLLKHFGYAKFSVLCCFDGLCVIFQFLFFWLFAYCAFLYFEIFSFFHFLFSFVLCFLLCFLYFEISCILIFLVFSSFLYFEISCILIFLVFSSFLYLKFLVF